MRGIPLSDSTGKMMGCKLLLVLTLWTMSTEAFHRGAPMKKCHLSKYKSLPPRELETFKNGNNSNVSARVILVKEELHLIIDVLENIGDSSLSELLGRPLEILKQIREDLKSCVSVGLHQPDNHQRSGRLTSWLQKFHAAKKMETPGCLEASVVLNLFRLLNEDLKCAAYMESCT
uniref:Uncharacterized protein n=1 Tax=Gopherus agassizii TaxID=38772 RepID=A0A452H9N6_9SAUR